MGLHPVRRRFYSEVRIRAEQLQQLADRGSLAATLLAALPIERRAMTGLMMLEEDRDASPPATLREIAPSTELRRH